MKSKEQQLESWRILSRQHRERDPVRMMLHRARSRAKLNGIPFEITKDDLEIPTHCPVLGIELNYYSRQKNQPNNASLDRIDNTKGYIRGNVIVISMRANQIKRDATIEELRLIFEFYRDLVTD